MPSRFTDARSAFHDALFDRLVRVNEAGYLNFADTSSGPSREIATRMVSLLGRTATPGKIAAQTAGVIFENLVSGFVRDCFGELAHLRPGRWTVERSTEIRTFDQYAHIALIAEATKSNAALAAALGRDYVIRPDIVIYRAPEPDASINRAALLVDDASARLTSLRETSGALPTLHASVSCKYTIRADRSQNSRAEALNLIRGRRGKTPQIAAVTAEPTPARIASLALGTGDIDCVYHFALYELQTAIEELGYADAREMLGIMIEGKRLRDISDLPLDLAI